MKIRTDFVTNSSSSSFIIAVKSDTTEAEAEAVVNKYFQGSINEVMSYSDDNDEHTEDEIKSRLVSIIMSARDGMKLGSWFVNAGEASSENGDAECVLHMADDVNAPKVKFKNVGC